MSAKLHPMTDSEREYYIARIDELEQPLRALAREARAANAHGRSELAREARAANAHGRSELARLVREAAAYAALALAGNGTYEIEKENT